MRILWCHSHYIKCISCHTSGHGYVSFTNWLDVQIQGFDFPALISRFSLKLFVFYVFSFIFFNLLSLLLSSTFLWWFFSLTQSWLMVDHTTISLGFPSVSFFFARLGVFFEYSGRRHPRVGLFMSREYALRSVLLELYPLIYQSLIWYHLASEMVEERLSELGMGFLPSNDPMGIEEDVTMSKPSTSSIPRSKPFQALIEECVLEWKHLKNLRKRF